MSSDSMNGICQLLPTSALQTSPNLQIAGTGVPLFKHQPATFRRTVTVSLAEKEATMKFSWEPVFLDALSDLQSPHLTQRIAAARELIDARVQELLATERHDKERVALIDALFALHCVEQYRRNRSSPESKLRVAS
jgi:predicted glycoside hydrolase/deacetylase ChbG (UPF0249 family)